MYTGVFVLQQRLPLYAYQLCNNNILNFLYNFRAISIINHPLLSTIRTVISTLTCTSMASNSTNDSGRTSTSKSTITALIVRGIKCVIN